jgi:6-pyruvoyltetrahydropterin/6-carboxytetrahydropterin synthase
MRVQVNRKAHFNSAHRLYNPKWTSEKNEQVFGLCNNHNFHGHNYNIIVSVTGEVNPETGYVIDMKILKQVIKTQVTDKLDHKNLNLDVPEFTGVIPTAENIVVICYKLIKEALPSNLDVKVTLFETERNFVVYPS